MVRAAIPEAMGLAREVSTSAWAASATVLKNEGGSAVLGGGSCVGPVVVKRQTLDRPKDAFSRLFGVTRLLRHWKGSERLAALGFSVAPCLALWRGRDERGRTLEFLAMKRLGGKTVLQHLADRDLGPARSFALAQKLGEDAARLVIAGWRNRDHKPSNLLVLDDEGGSSGSAWPRVALLDTVGIRRAASPREALGHMLFSLLVEPVGCGVAAPPILRRAAVSAAACIASRSRVIDTDPMSLWREVRALLGRHGDPTPQVNPLD